MCLECNVVLIIGVSFCCIVLVSVVEFVISIVVVSVLCLVWFIRLVVM